MSDKLDFYLEVLALMDAGETGADIARRFGMHQGLVGRVRRRKAQYLAAKQWRAFLKTEEGDEAFRDILGSYLDGDMIEDIMEECSFDHISWIHAIRPLMTDEDHEERRIELSRKYHDHQKRSGKLKQRKAVANQISSSPTKEPDYSGENIPDGLMTSGFILR